MAKQGNVQVPSTIDDFDNFDNFDNFDDVDVDVDVDDDLEEVICEFPNISDEELILKLSTLYRSDFGAFARDCLKIRTKSGAIKPFILNDAQADFLEKVERQLQLDKLVRFIILKSRQMGFSTVIEGIIYWWTINHVGIKSLVLTHRDSATKSLFAMTRRFYQNTPPYFVSKATNESANELTFKDIDSSIATATAGAKHTAHGETIQCLHWSEVSRSNNQEDMTSGVVQTVPNTQGSMIFLESTANGEEYFKETWDSAVRGENEYEPVFYPWTMMSEYSMPSDDFTFSEDERRYQRLHKLTDEQLAWRQRKISSFRGSPERKLALFKEQYPTTPEEAFISNSISFIDPELVQRARKSNYEPVGAIVMGVDPARKGKDTTGIVLRQGRKVLKVFRMKIPDTMLIASKVAKLINEWNCDAVFIDTIGVGAGVYDRLKQMGYGHIIYEAIASKQADSPHRYYNKRAEMWDRLSQWLLDGADIPDNEHFASDILLPTAREDGNERLIMQKKSEMKRSPDTADALIITFYVENIIRRSDDDKIERYGRFKGGNYLNGNI